jgi:hypothetical protein
MKWTNQTYGMVLSGSSISLPFSEQQQSPTTYKIIYRLQEIPYPIFIKVEIQYYETID